MLQTSVNYGTYSTLNGTFSITDSVFCLQRFELVLYFACNSSVLYRLYTFTVQELYSTTYVPANNQQCILSFLRLPFRHFMLCNLRLFSFKCPTLLHVHNNILPISRRLFVRLFLILYHTFLLFTASYIQTPTVDDMSSLLSSRAMQPSLEAIRFPP